MQKLLKCLENENPIFHIPTTELVKGDATRSINEYLDKHPETILSMVYFDIYQPNKVCLLAIRPHFTRGAVVGFDELNFNAFPEETLALKEVFGLENVRLKRSPFGVLQSYFILD